ncbi:hypothetical protein [Mycoplasmopsis meleagridis]|uniref:hypothetical protein n=1 Tax=Mycoplasmopsis meleagridis TaxID=29561 RepID=UPI00073D3127|nr:hypothetical protein [Mycoplasmopsis meleagridis]KUH47176.1 hypothetical protein ASB56_02845 [Mycoplasmopsis meleagridis]
MKKIISAPPKFLTTAHKTLADYVCSEVLKELLRYGKEMQNIILIEEANKLLKGVLDSATISSNYDLLKDYKMFCDKCNWKYFPQVKIKIKYRKNIFSVWSKNIKSLLYKAKLFKMLK